MRVKRFSKNHLLIPLFLILTVSVFVPSVFGWSNGGYSEFPSNPDYGTHDWIAEHALDWLPSNEKEYIENNLATYLYGTELPDNGGVSDGIGDNTKHHIYYASDETLQDDVSADRALEEYNLALNYLNTNDFVNAAKHAGIMTHYIADLAVFGHVMGAPTVWGVELHHSDYESYVNTRTNSYTDDFNIYLSYDGSLEVITAYDAAVDLAYDTTFDVDGDLTCVWMEENYDWGNPAFTDRCGESLNSAVNYVADVLHSLYVDSDLQNSNGDNLNPADSNEPIVINEVELNPPGDDNSGSVEEWIELYNPSSSSVDLSGWKLSTTHGGTVTVTISQGTIILADGYYVYNRGSQWLDNNDESVVLRDSGDVEIDRTPVKSDTENNGWSWQRYPNGLDTDSASDWSFLASTEGTSNGDEPAPDTASPTISNVGVNPGSGSTGTVFTISVDVSDPSGVNSVVAYIQSPDETNIATVTLTDPESDGTYTGTWDSTGSSSGTYLVDIISTDSLTNSGEDDNAVTFIVTKITSTISCSVSQDSLTLGNSLTVSGSINPEISGKTVTLTYTKPDSSTLIRTDTTNPGAYTDTYTPDVDGSWSVTASWDGDANSTSASSSSISFTVTKISTTLSCSTSSSEINLEDSITVSGDIDPALSSKTVTVTYTKPDGSTVTRTVTTGSDGNYRNTYTPDADGSWSVSCSWDSDATHDGSSSSSKSFTVKKSGCLIATATYGSELSPQVQFLRGFRDNTVYSTFAGSSFMTMFNEFYYSFSPSVALVIADNSVLRDVMKVVLYPLIGILQVSSTVFSVFSFLPEFGVVVAGLIASSLIGIVYFTPIALIVSLKKKFKVSEKSIRQMGLILISSVLLLIVAEGFQVPSMMMVSTGAFVLVTMATATLNALRIITKRMIH